MEYSFKNKLEIDGTVIGFQEPCYIVAEIGINHNGDIKIAKKLIDGAKEAGANAVKFQKRNLDELYKSDVLQDPTIESQGFEILLAELKNVEFTDEQFHEIIKYCKEIKITFLCTAWDKKSLEFLDSMNVSAFKIASADMTNFPLIENVIKTKKPIIISTGMSTLEEIEKTVKFLKDRNSKFVLLHSNSTYPAPIESLNLSLIHHLKEKFDVPIGYSGHEPDIIPSIMAANLGAVVLERHITLDKEMEGLDHAASLNLDEFSTLVKNIRECEIAYGKPHKKMTRGEVLQREVLGKSIVCKKDIKENELFTEQNIEAKGPAKGISPQYYFELMGKKATREIKKGEFIQDEDI